MGFFLAHTWPWWLLAIALGLIITWLIFRDRKRGKHTHDEVDLKAQNERLKAELEEKNKDHAAIKARNAELESQVGEIPPLKTRVAELEPIANEHASLKDEHAALVDSHEALKAEHASLKTRNDELEGAVGELALVKARNEELESGSEQNESLKARNAELEGVANEHASLKDDHAALVNAHGALKGEHESLKSEHESLKARNAELEPLAIEHPGLKARNSELEGTADELAAQRQECAQHTNDLTDAHARIAELEAASEAAPASAAAPENTASEAAPASAAVPAQAGPAEEAPADVSGAQEVLGYKLKADDLTEIEGIGPKIRDLLHAKGITTWRAMSQADVPTLEGILREAGPRFQMHHPGTWPRQAGYLADGDWEAHKAMTATLRGGRERV